MKNGMHSSEHKMNGQSAVPNQPPEVTKIKGEIDQEKVKRVALIDQLRRLRNKLNYKEAEYAALSKLSVTARPQKSNFGRLKKLKSDLEFKIATEATTLNSEKELIKRLTAINEQLDEALKAFRFRRKVEFVSKDVEEIKKALESYTLQVLEVDKKLDVLYSNLRELTGWKKKEERRQPRKMKQEEHFQVSLEDIATIKGKKNDSGSGV